VAVPSLAQGKHTRKRAAKQNWRKSGQQVMHAERVREIQAALIRENYLRGRANGVWNQRSKDAMVRFQSDNGWQSIKLGLGPDHTDLISPDTAAISIIPSGGTPTSDRGRSIPNRREWSHITLNDVVGGAADGHHCPAACPTRRSLS
jgi:peptidoglycan hydrolase-like protein with peptidoglycan-binding domain